MGAPTILVEKLGSGRETECTIEALVAIVSNEGNLEEVDTGEGVKTISNIRALMLEKKQVLVR